MSISAHFQQVSSRREGRRTKTRIGRSYHGWSLLKLRGLKSEAMSTVKRQQRARVSVSIRRFVLSVETCNEYTNSIQSS